MMILCQNKTLAVNFRNVMYLRVVQCEVDAVLMSGDTVCLAVYDSHDRAVAVFEEYFNRNVGTMVRMPER